ncbi:MAG: TonB-dependent receptor domain-containing protein, partial [Ilyomonas sp.]
MRSFKNAHTQIQNIFSINIRAAKIKSKRYFLFSFFLLFTSASFAQADTTVTFKVEGACAGQCKPRIQSASKVKGVASAIWNVDTKMLTLVYDPSKVSLNKIQELILDAGHDLADRKAKDRVYEALPACCHYREINEQNVLEEHGRFDTATLLNNIIKGVVLEEDSKGSFKPLQGASVVWLDTNAGTITDENGVFHINDNGERLIISYTGFKSDTISVIPSHEIKIILGSNNQLNEVKVTSSRGSRYITSADVFRTENMTQKELFKAACCNLSESFETNPSVDVSYNDAVTGSKQIQLLGLAGIYTQLTVENLPGPRGLATSLGLNSIPGIWIEGIQLSKGTGSVANGFESIAGQINVEQKKPFNSERLYANIYVNNFGKTDLNMNLTQKINKKWATTVLLHNAYLNNKTDFNKDGFRDLPTGNLFTGMNRWSYDNSKGLTSHFGIKYLKDNKTGGQLNFNPNEDKFTSNSYGLEINTNRVEAFGKLGYVFPQKKYKSIGLQLSGFDHQQNSYFGMTTYNAHQQSFYANLIYQSIINTTLHKFRTGLSFQYDKYDEDFKLNNYRRQEIIPGAFFEYTYTPSTNFSLVAGIREDHNSLYGWFTTPRLNVRYEPIKGTVIRGSIGRGQRTANIFAENNGVFASARNVIILPSTEKGAYGLKPEIAWNKGISIDQKFSLFHRAASLGMDFFRNDFTNQVVVDLEDARAIKLYNLQGKSYSNSFQTELSFTPAKKLDVKLAYRLFDVKTTYNGQLLQKPLTAQNRAFANLAYEFNRWKFDYTVSYSGRKRLPSTAANPIEFQQPAYASSFVTMNTQISKTFGNKNLFDVYVGAENLTRSE